MSASGLRKPVLYRQAGLTLVELMVALVLSMMLLGGVITVFQANKTTFYTQEGLAQLQENGRMALTLISQDLRNAGYRGCNSRSAVYRDTLDLDGTSDYVWEMDNRVDGFEAVNSSGWVPAMDAAISGKSTAPSATDISDVLTVRFSDGDSARVTAHATSTAALSVTGGSGIEAGDILLASTCEYATLFQATAFSGGDIAHATGSGTPGNDSANLVNTFPGGEVSKVTVRTYFVADGAGGRPSLWRIEDNGAPQEVVEGIDNLQVLYAIDTDNNFQAESYVAANAVSDWDDVVAVRLSVLASSLNNNATDADNVQSVTFDGRDANPDGDRRLRQAFTTTVALRSRVP